MRSAAAEQGASPVRAPAAVNAVGQAVAGSSAGPDPLLWDVPLTAARPALLPQLIMKCSVGRLGLPPRSASVDRCADRDESSMPDVADGRRGRTCAARSDAIASESSDVA